MIIKKEMNSLQFLKESLIDYALKIKNRDLFDLLTQENGDEYVVGAESNLSLLKNDPYLGIDLKLFHAENLNIKQYLSAIILSDSVEHIKEKLHFFLEGAGLSPAVIRFVSFLLNDDSLLSKVKLVSETEYLSNAIFLYPRRAAVLNMSSLEIKHNNLEAFIHSFPVIWIRIQ